MSVCDIIKSTEAVKKKKKQFYQTFSFLRKNKKNHIFLSYLILFCVSRIFRFIQKIYLYKFEVSLWHHFYSQLFPFTFRTWWTRCGSVLLHKTRWRFAAVCRNFYLLSTKWFPISSVTNSAKSLWTLVARTGRCSTTTSLQTPFR